MIELSICITTFKRADMIGETLQSIVSQLVNEVEVVVLDGASPDTTAAVVSAVNRRDPRVRYIREETNSGVDADFDKAVQAARGRHCWLFSDDDTMAPGAIASVLNELRRSDPDLLVVDAEVRDLHLCTVLEPRRLAFAGRRVYDSGDQDRVLAELGDALSFIGSTVVRRSIWLARERRPYYGSLFIHVGTLFQAPLQSVVALGYPLVRIRIGNAMWSARAFQVWMLMWPELIWQLPGFSAAARTRVTPRRPWLKSHKLLVWRAHGVFGLTECNALPPAGVGRARQVSMRLIARMPGRLAHVLVVALMAARGLGTGSAMYQLVGASPFTNRLSRWIAQRAGYGRDAHVPAG